MGEKRNGFELIIETQNNGNFEYIKRKNPNLVVEHDGWIVKLCKDNSNIVEDLIEENDNYSISFAKLVYEGILFEHNGSFSETDENAIEAMIRVIDRDNSTQVWQHGKERIFRMVDYIKNPVNSFWQRLEACDTTLVDDLIESAKDDSGDGDNLISLSSKICKYLSQFRFNNYNSYFISDRFVRRALPFYCAHYDIEIDGLKKNNPQCSFFDKYNYADLFNVLLELQRKTNSGICEDDKLNKHQIDHILWFCYRSRTKVENENNPV